MKLTEDGRRKEKECKQKQMMLVADLDWKMQKGKRINAKGKKSR